MRGREETGGVALTLISSHHIPACVRPSSPAVDLLYRVPDQPLGW